MNCGPADTYLACKTQCQDNLETCVDNCQLPSGCRFCGFGYNQCLSACGTPPTTNIGC